MTSEAPVSIDLGSEDAPPALNLGARLKAARLSSGMSLRELARQLGVSPSFVSQLENGKSQPSVATLYSLSQLLGLSMDELFGADGNRPTTAPVVVEAELPTGLVSRGALGSPADAWPSEGADGRISVIPATGRARLVMDSGVMWEQLATVGHNLDFMEIVYPPGSSSTNDGRMLRHSGYEYGYLLEGELHVTLGFENYVLRAGESIGLNSSIPHLLTNKGAVPARGIWCVHHCAPLTDPTVGN
jgi:transcriptional regulator with XRE-family HTH domain/quercetin dioxygenase-like cupin family protein